MAFMYDSASPNLKSIREVLLPMFFTGAHGFQCLSHMFNNTGTSSRGLLVIFCMFCGAVEGGAGWCSPNNSNAIRISQVKGSTSTQPNVSLVG